MISRPSVRSHFVCNRRTCKPPSTSAYTHSPSRRTSSRPSTVLPRRASTRKAMSAPGEHDRRVDPFRREGLRGDSRPHDGQGTHDRGDEASGTCHDDLQAFLRFHDRNLTTCLQLIRGFRQLRRTSSLSVRRARRVRGPGERRGRLSPSTPVPETRSGSRCRDHARPVDVPAPA
jgi:hypothetical protein